jgi:hypothetical protein
LLAVTAVTAWDRLSDVPNHVDVDYGTELIWGDTLLWGLFPSDGENTTYLGSFNPNVDPEEEDPWDTLRISGVPLDRDGIAFQWVERPVVWAMGIDLNEVSRLYQYDVRTGTTTQEIITRFTLDIGASIAYVPNEGFHPYWNPTPGYLYFLPGGDSTFWRRSITARDLPDPQIYGYEFPGDEVSISDPTPTFRWTPWESELYRLEISTNLNFTSNVIDTVVPTAEWQSSVELDSGTYYWRVSTWVEGSGGGYWDPAQTFPRQVSVYPCWAQLPGLDHDAHSGARLAFCDEDAFGHKSVVAMYGNYLRRFAEYNIEENTWTRRCDVPDDVEPPSSLTTNAAVGGDYRVYAAFNADVENECPHYYSVVANSWGVLDKDSTDPTYDTHFPDDLDPGASMAIGADDMMYLTTGYARRFYGVSVSSFPGGQQARVVPSGRAKAQAVSVRGGVEVEYLLPAAAYVRASLHDALGRQVGTLDVGKQSAGVHRLGWNCSREGRKLSVGTYFVSLDLGAEQINLKTVVQ